MILFFIIFFLVALVNQLMPELHRTREIAYPAIHILIYLPHRYTSNLVALCGQFPF
jgi:hypothetical protein